MLGRPHTDHRQTRWGVGFGPRDCSDYQTGISIIPIERLTDADRKWMLTAEYGGSGGKPIETGMVVEEPDIEIGAGVSSKGIEFSSLLWSLVLEYVLKVSYSYKPSHGHGPRGPERPKVFSRRSW